MWKWIARVRGLKQRMVDWVRRPFQPTPKTEQGESQWREFLLRVGWQPEKCGMSYVTAVPGFHLFAAAEEVLAKYGGCYLKVPHGPSALIQPAACVDAYGQLIKEFAEYLGEDVYPVGIFEYQDDWGIVITPKGHVYAMLCELPFAMAVNFEDALRCFLYDDRELYKQTLKRMEGSGMVVWRERWDAWERGLMGPGEGAQPK